MVYSGSSELVEGGLCPSYLRPLQGLQWASEGSVRLGSPCTEPGAGACSPPLAPSACWPVTCSVLCRREETVTVYPADVVLFEGILAFYSQEVRDLFHMKLFVDTDADTRLSRRGA